MHEVITISVSHRANHLSTQFFNCQEETLLNADPKDSIDPSIFLNPTIDKISKTVSYSPRALLWESKNGFGSLGKYQYIPESLDYHFNDNHSSTTTSTTEKNISVISTHSRIPKSEYQNALDTAPSNLPKLTKENTKYWSDYSKLIFEPRSFNTLQNWYHKVDTPNIPDYQNLDRYGFTTFEQGVQEFNICKNDFLDSNLRIMLEQADTLQGINLITDLDSGWGGFATQLIQEVRDELPKSTIFTYGFNELDMFSGSKINHTNTRNKIKSTLSMRQESDLFFPMFADSQNLSNWEIGGQICRLFDTINSVVSQRDREQRKSMDYITTCLINDDQLRNIVTSLYDTNYGYDYSFHTRVNKWEKNNRSSEEYHTFAYCLITRGERDETSSENLQEGQNRFKAVRELHTTTFRPSDTIPEKFVEKKLVSIKMSAGEKSRDVFKNWNTYISRMFKLDEDREELKDETSNLASAYEFGYYDDEDSGDDY